MNSQITMYITLVCTSGVFNLFLCVYMYLKRQQFIDSSKYFILSTAATTIYCFGYAFSLTSSTLAELRFWNVFQYIGMPFAPSFALMFVLSFLGFPMTKKLIGVILIIPFLSFLVDATNQYHHLFYKSYEIHPTLGAPFTEIEVGIGFVIHGVYTFACMFCSFLLLSTRWKDTTNTIRSQYVFLICAQLVPIVTAFLYLIDVTPDGIDPVPMVVWLSSLLFFLAIVSSRMLTIMPIAKDTIFHSMSDGVIVLDDFNRLIEFNQAASTMIKQFDRSLLGLQFEHIWGTITGNPLPLLSNNNVVVQEIALANEGKMSFYQVRPAPLRHPRKDRAGMLLILTDITQTKKLQQELELLVYYDELTQIYNRRAFFEHCESAFEDARRNAQPFTIIMLDVDHFKKVNDTYGHQIGDELLVHVAGRCKEILPPDIIFSRYGGEEFILAHRGTSSEGQALANQIRQQLEKNPLVTSNHSISITASFGVADTIGITGEAVLSLHQLLQRADEALYAAKKGGRNLVREYACIC